MLREERNQGITDRLLNKFRQNASQVDATIMFGLINGILFMNRNEVMDFPTLWPSGLVEDPPDEDGQRRCDDRGELFQNPG